MSVGIIDMVVVYITRCQLSSFGIPFCFGFYYQLVFALNSSLHHGNVTEFQKVVYSRCWRYLGIFPIKVASQVHSFIIFIVFCKNIPIPAVNFRTFPLSFNHFVSISTEKLKKPLLPMFRKKYITQE